MKKALISVNVLLALSLGAAGVVNASTSAEKQAAIDAGLAHLAATQNPDGSWTDINSSAYNPADTAAALLAFTEQAYKPLGWHGADYSSVVTKATDYLLSTAQTLPFASGGNWSGFGAGVGTSGIQWNYGNENTYITGLVIPALSRLVSNPYGGGGTPIYSSGTVISSSNTVVNGLTYAQVIQKAVDSFTYYQTGPDYGNRYGGWRYFAGENDSDMSTTQWPVISYLFAQGITSPPPAITKTALQAWLAAVQDPVTGGVDYAPGGGIVNATHAGGFLLSNFFAGGGGDAAKALAWLNANWKGGPSGTWYGNEDGSSSNPYAMWAIYKALETLYGTTGVGPISNLNLQTTSLDSGATWNWWEDYCQYLVTSQNGDGSFDGYQYWGGAMVDAWDINILNATQTGPGPGTVPEPSTMVLLGSGLIGLLGYARKRRRQ